METYGKILLIAMPVFLMLVLLEKWFGWYKGKDTVVVMDMISSLSSGVTNVTKDVLGLSVAIISYGWMVEHMSVTHINSSIAVYVISFLVLDFAGYWIHRIQHTTNVFWNAHIIHHSSEEFNLACALRQSISVFFKLFTFFLIPAALLGIPQQVVAVVAPLHLFIQFWYHTQHISRMGFLEKIIVTPSHHRVHHAINPLYIDKNYSQVFIIWDKLFGTFQEEREDTPPVYGITVPVSTWNPVKINFKHMLQLISDAWHTESWKDKFRIWFMPTGWRPDDVIERYPLNKIEDVYNFTKYNPSSSVPLRAWSLIQLFFLLLFVSYLFANLAQIGSPGIFYYGLFIFLFIYAMTDLMDRNRSAVIGEIIKCITGFYLIYFSGGWFGSQIDYPFIPQVVGAYLVSAMAMALYFAAKHLREDQQPVYINKC